MSPATVLGKAGPQLTGGAIVSYGIQDIMVTRYDVLVCAGRLSWEIPHSSGAGFMRQDTVITRHDIKFDTERTLIYRQDISENAHNLADESNLDARAELGTFRRDFAQSGSVTTAMTSATGKPEYAPVSRPNAVASSKPRVRLDCAIQESDGLSTVVSAAEYSASEQRTPVRSFGGSKITGFREAVNVDHRSEYSSLPPEPPAQSAHAGFVQDVLPLRRHPNAAFSRGTWAGTQGSTVLDYGSDFFPSATQGSSSSTNERLNRQIVCANIWRAEESITHGRRTVAVESLGQSENVMVSNTNTNVLSLSEPGIAQGAELGRIRSARERQFSEINVALTTFVQTSSYRSIENGVKSSLVTISEGSRCSDVVTGQPDQHFPSPKSDSNEQAEQTVESRGRREPETGSELMISHSHSVERSTSKTAVSKTTTQTDEDTNFPALPPSQMTTLPASDPRIPQNVGVDFIQSGCEHPSSGVDQTLNHDCSTESKGYRSAQSFSCSDEPETTSSVHVCLSLAQNSSNSPSSMEKAVDNLQKSSSVSNEISKSSFTSTTCHNQSLVASTHEESCGQDMTRDQLQSSSQALPNVAPSKSLQPTSRNRFLEIRRVVDCIEDNLSGLGPSWVICEGVKVGW
ncbi:uncharacterized protein EDB93DRAFT_1265779 [Suillus bovinus]|uniref:uncharacterized protein n=1 Tax=Suillus bovinus TaxID=48563 RepID=UPI001B85C914|nr:uncharacterized protein EDB93DRAFT_1265779 [Suillus bovinus]KAG2129407.1 hypothetical protein EDB93DRAFT_1265779 [Suillus bovinus]